MADLFSRQRPKTVEKFNTFGHPGSPEYWAGVYAFKYNNAAYRVMKYLNHHGDAGVNGKLNDYGVNAPAKSVLAEL